MATPAQCSRCEMIWELVNSGERRLEEIGSVLGLPAPSIVRHLKDHGRAADNLMHLVTYGGQPLRRDSDAPTTDIPAIAPEVDPAPTGETAGGDWPEDTDPQELVDAGLVTPDQIDDTDPTLDFRAIVHGLATAHPHPPVKEHARLLGDALDEWAGLWQDRIRLEQLTVQRDQLQAQIDAIEARLHPSAEPTDGSDGAGLVLPWEQIREWGRQHGYPVKPTGKVARSVVEAWRSATDGQVAS